MSLSEVNSRDREGSVEIEGYPQAASNPTTLQLEQTSKSDSESCENDDDEEATLGMFDPSLFTSHVQEEKREFLFGQNKEIRVTLLCVHDYYQQVAKFVSRTVWPSSMALCSYFADNPSLVRGKRILELGSGTGLCGIVIALLGAKQVVLTDYSKTALESLRKSVMLNNVDKICSVHSLTWGNKETAENILQNEQKEKFDIVIGTDVIYEPECITPLFQSVQHLKDTQHGKFYLVNHTCRYSPLEAEVQKEGIKTGLVEKKHPDIVLESDGRVAMTVFS